MAKKTASAGIDFVLHDNGQAVATLTPVDAAGLDTTLPEGSSIPAWVSSDPGVVVSPSTDGLSAIVSPSVPPVMVTGVTLTVSCTLPDSTVITGVSDPIDVVGGGPTGFKIALA